MAISGSVSSVSQIKGSISSGNELVVTRITVPGPQGPQGTAGSSVNNVSQSQDVDVSSLQDGALLQYRASDGKFVTRTEIVTTTGTLLFNCGNF